MKNRAIHGTRPISTVMKLKPLVAVRCGTGVFQFTSQVA